MSAVGPKPSVQDVAGRLVRLRESPQLLVGRRLDADRHERYSRRRAVENAERPALSCEHREKWKAAEIHERGRHEMDAAKADEPICAAVLLTQIDLATVLVVEAVPSAQPVKRQPRAPKPYSGSGAVTFGKRKVYRGCP